MKLTVTDRDRKLLLVLGVVLLIAGAVLLVIRPLKAANDQMEQQVLDNEIQMEVIQQKIIELPQMRSEQKEIADKLEEGRQGLYPMLKRQEIDKLLTEQVVSMGLDARRLQIEMPEKAMNLIPYQRYAPGAETPEGSNPDGADGIWAADIGMEVAGSQEQLDSLIEFWSVDRPGIRVLDFNWSAERNYPGVHVLNLNLEVLMCSDGEQKE